MIGINIVVCAVCSKFPYVLVPEIVGFMDSRPLCDAYREDVPALAPPEEEVVAGAEVSLHDVLIAVPDHDVEVKVVFHPSFIDGSKRFSTPIFVRTFDPGAKLRCQSPFFFDLFPDTFHGTTTTCGGSEI